MNFGFVENSSVDCSLEQSTDLSFYAEHYESSDLMTYENHAIVSNSRESIESNVMMPMIRHVVAFSISKTPTLNEDYSLTEPDDVPYTYIGNRLVDGNYDSYMESGHYLSIYSIRAYDNRSYLYGLPANDNKGGGNFPFTLHYEIPNSITNRQVHRLYTSGFV